MKMGRAPLNLQRKGAGKGAGGKDMGEGFARGSGSYFGEVSGRIGNFGLVPDGIKPTELARNQYKNGFTSKRNF